MLRVFEAFSGIGTQRMALRNLGIEHEVVCIAEIDKFAIRSYEAIHGETLNLGDVSKIDPNDVPDHDLFTYSFPCQDISIAGKGKGFKPESGTRSSLLWECEKIIEAKKPKYLLMENVKALISKKFKPGFDKWLELLDGLGYTNYWEVLNAKDYGIPQNRERVFCVSILGEHEPYEFPKPFELEIRLKDILEDEVDEKFYINNDRTNVLLKNLETSKLQKDSTNVNQIGNCVESKGSFKNPQRGRVYSENGCSPAFNCVGGGGLEPKILRIGNINPNKTGQSGNVYNPNGISPTLDTCQGGNRMPKITEPTIVASRGRNPDKPSDRTTGSPTEQRLEVNKQGISNTLTSVQKDNYVLEPKIQKVGKINSSQDRIVVDIEGIAPTHTAGHGNCPKVMVKQATKKGNYVLEPEIIKEFDIPNYRIRKLTPKECWRLMGISDEDFEKAQEVNSNTQLYKQAGNAIVVDVLEGIFRKLFLSKSKEKGNKLEEQLEWLDELLGVGK